MRIIQDTQKPLNVNDAYICAIEAMYHWQGWNERWYSETHIHSDQSPIVRDLQISWHDLPDRPTNMHWYHIKLAISVLLNTMDHRHEFTEARVEMQHFEKVFGILEIGRPTTAAAAATANNTTSASDSGGNGRVVANSTKGIPTALHDTETPASKTILIPFISEVGTPNITYQRLGAPVPCPILFNTALDGLVDTGTDMHGDPWSWSTAFDYTQKMMYQTQWAAQQKPGEGGGSFQWTADMIALAARLLPQRLFEEGDCGEVRFRMELDQVGRIGTGSFQLLDFARQRAKGGVE
ncbi:MAG: hypothetical protein Q9168_005567 [Polycauliona sp. 1 TL-2023]